MVFLVDVAAVPEGRMEIAQRFSAGTASEDAIQSRRDG
jgi:hypothetical protein